MRKLHLRLVRICVQISVVIIIVTPLSISVSRRRWFGSVPAFYYFFHHYSNKYKN